MSDATDRARASRDELLAELRNAGVDTTSPKKLRCPFHEDNHPSAGVYEKDGVWRFKCHGCGVSGDVFDIKARVSSRSLDDVLVEESKKSAPAPRPAAKPKPERTKTTYPTIERMQEVVPNCTDAYRYTHPDTKAVEMVVLRIEPPGKKKEFLQARPLPTGGWVMEGPEKPWPLYNRARVRDAKVVIVVEGEKCVHALHEIGIVATTSPGGAGAGKAELADWSLLAGKEVYLWPDNDEVDPRTHERQGIRHMRNVSTILRGLDDPPTLLWIDPDSLGLPAKGDVVQFLEPMEGGTPADKADAVNCVLADATSLEKDAALGSLLEDIIAGKRFAVSWPWRVFKNATQALLPGTVTMVCGHGGATKSFFLLQAAAYWLDAGVNVAVLQMEDSHEYHLRRALAQHSESGRVLDDEWVRSCPDQVRALFSEHRDFLRTLGKSLHEPSSDEMSLDEIVTWADEQGRRGARVIAIDPVTAASTSDKRWLDDQKFVIGMKRLAVTYDLSVVLITHPRKGGGGKTTMEELAGGAAYTRFAHSVLWLQATPEPEEYTIKGDYGLSALTSLHEANRVMRMLKTRNGPGSGKEIAFNFEPRTMRFEEVGLIVDTKGK